MTQDVHMWNRLHACGPSWLSRWSGGWLQAAFHYSLITTREVIDSFE